MKLFNRVSRRIRSCGRKRPPFRRDFESLEDRCLLSIFEVTNTGDNGGMNPSPNAGTGTLRQAIVDADFNGGPNEIQFDITSPGVQTISLDAALPEITDQVTVNGYTQPGASRTH